ncbi:MAG TPA: STAS domain-containing protein [Leptospiraceae bacterium]|nr:STAS domain-containing protein [Leptospiraceae bacterium]HRG72924.1 STAS domain-containing protein [Leptospiraceae bacterium]
MNYSHSQIDNIDILELEESIDLYSTPTVKKFAKTLLNSPDRKIIVSLEKVTFIDSSGLGMLVNLFFECRQKDIPIRLAVLSEKAKKIFTISKLHENYEIYNSIEDAIQSFS